MSQNPREFFSQNGFFSLFSMLVCIRSGRLDWWTGSFVQASIMPNGDARMARDDTPRSAVRICDGCRRFQHGRSLVAGVTRACCGMPAARDMACTGHASRMSGVWRRGESVKDKNCQRHDLVAGRWKSRPVLSGRGAGRPASGEIPS